MWLLIVFIKKESVRNFYYSIFCNKLLFTDFIYFKFLAWLFCPLPPVSFTGEKKGVQTDAVTLEPSDTILFQYLLQFLHPKSVEQHKRLVPRPTLQFNFALH